MTDQERITAAERFGRTLGVIAAHSMLVVQQAIQACREGKATPRQQKIAMELFDAATWGK